LNFAWIQGLKRFFGWSPRGAEVFSKDVADQLKAFFAAQSTSAGNVHTGIPSQSGSAPN
jgi:hypothetical protein